MTKDSEPIGFHVIELIERMDVRFYREFDPFYFWTVAECVHSAKHAPIQLVEKKTLQSLDDHELMQRIERSRGNYSLYSSYLVRALRYFCSETLMLLLFSQVGKNPFARVASVKRGERLFGAIREVSLGNVPDEHAASSSGIPLAFEEWLSFRAFGSPTTLTDYNDETLFQLVREEASLVCERGAINAFKHGKAVSFGKGLSLAIAGNDGQFSAINEVVEGLNWVDWFEDQKNNRLSISFGTEELAPEKDKKRIFATCLLMDAIVEARKAEIDGRNELTLQLPSDFPKGSAVKRQKFKFDLGSEKKT